MSVRDMHSKVFKEHKKSLFNDESQTRDREGSQHHSIIPSSCEMSLSVTGQIFIRTIPGKTLALDMAETESVEVVKSLIESKEGVPAHQQRLFFNGKQLTNYTTLYEYEIRNASTLELSLSLPGGGVMEVYIKTTGGVTILVKVERETTILELKQKIQQQKGYTVEQQKLIFCGAVLEDSLTLADYNIQRATTLHLVVGQRHGEKRVSITVMTKTNREIKCSVLPTDTLESVVEIIKEKEEIPKQSQHLYHKGVLVDHKTPVKDFFKDTKKAPSPKQELHMYLEVKGNIEIFIDILSGASRSVRKRISVCVSHQTKVSVLKRIIEHREGIPTYFQTLLYSGGVMADNCSLGEGENPIKNKSTVYLWPERLNTDTKLSVTVRTPTNSVHLQSLDLFTKISDVKVQSKCLLESCETSFVRKHSLFHGNTHLEDDKCVYEHRITESSELCLVPPEHFPVFVNVKVNGKLEKYFVTVKKSDTVKTLKNKLYSVAMMPVAHSLYLAGLLLKDGKTMEVCHVTPGCFLTSVSSGEIPISVRTRLTTITLSIDPTQKVLVLMENISSTPEIGVEIDKQRLLLQNTVITSKQNRRQSLQHLGVSPGNTLTLVVLPGELDIHVSVSQGKWLSLVCSRDSTIRDVKRAIEESEDVPVDNQVLPFPGDDKALSAYRLEPGAHFDLVHLSGTHQLAKSDPGEVWERVIIQQQNQQLKEQLETVNDSMWSIKGSLEKDKAYIISELGSKVRQLEGENDELRQELEKERQRMPLKETQPYLVMRQESSSQLKKGLTTLSDIPEDCDATEDSNTISTDAEVEPTSKEPQLNESSLSITHDISEYGFLKEIVYTGKEYVWSLKEHGIALSFPQHHTSTNILVSMMSLNNSSELIAVQGDDHAEFVSAVYHIQVSSPLPVPVTMEIQHCVHITDHDVASSLSFVKSNENEDHFTAIEGGQFELNRRYGCIKISQFSHFGIVQFFRRLHRNTLYIASIFTKKVDYKHQLDVIVTRDIPQHLRQLESEYIGWQRIVQPEIKFEGPITVNHDPEQVSTEGTKHWVITEIQKGAKIMQQSVNKYRPGRRIPRIRLRAMWESPSPVQRADITMVMYGAVDPVGEKVLFIFECKPFNYEHSASFSSDISSPCSSVTGQPFSRIECPHDWPIFNERVTMEKLDFIQFNDGSGDRELRIRAEIEGEWRVVASQLGLSDARIGALAQSQTPTRDMLSVWLQTDTGCVWRKLIGKLCNAGLTTQAFDLRHALKYAVPDSPTSSQDVSSSQEELPWTNRVPPHATAMSRDDVTASPPT